MSKRMVIDASVAAKWFLSDEPDYEVAEDILLASLGNELELYAPRIFSYEVCSLLAKACGSRDPTTKALRLTKERAVECVRKLFGLPISITEATENEGTEAVGMAVDFSRKFYDMTYLRLADSLDCEWCTADRKFLAGGYPSLFPAHRVVILSSLQSS
jgi:predicted nucleic acid-binding protein